MVAIFSHAHFINLPADIFFYGIRAIFAKNNFPGFRRIQNDYI